MPRIAAGTGEKVCVYEPKGETKFSLSLAPGSQVIFTAGVIPYITSVTFSGNAHSAHADVTIVEVGGGYALPIPEGVDFH